MTTLEELDELRQRGDAVARVIAERLELDPAYLVSGGLLVDVQAGRETVTWRGLRHMPSGFMAECVAEAARRAADAP